MIENIHLLLSFKIFVLYKINSFLMLPLFNLKYIMKLKANK
ncbi:hypothetical protein PJ15_2339 [Acinetobacter sp. neg1]|nr:hypothetical protein PJ15_2339 [Acinetobacter sp. neg1]